MSPLRRSLKNPKTWLAFFGTLFLLTVLDTCRAPAHQVTGSVYVAGVRVYQKLGRPLLKDHVRCRYEPTCSEYSIQAVQTHGIRRGLDRAVPKSQIVLASKPGGPPWARLRRGPLNPDVWRRRLRSGSVRLGGLELTWDVHSARPAR